MTMEVMSSIWHENAEYQAMRGGSKAMQSEKEDTAVSRLP